MSGTLNIQAFMHSLANMTPEDTFGQAVQNLYIIENNFSRRNNDALRNRTRATIACLKILYDHAQQMSLARLYLIHRLRIFEAREQDMDAELSILRGITPSGEDGIITKETIGNKLQGRDNQSREDDSELEIIMDQKMIDEIDKSEAVLRDISREIEENKNTLTDIDQQMNNVSTILTSSGEHFEAYLREMNPTREVGPNGSEWTQGLVTPNHSRDGDTRILSPKIYNMEMNKDTEINLRPQRSRSLSDRRTSPTVPGEGMSLSYAGPAHSLPTGEERESATVDAKMEEKYSKTPPREFFKEPEIENYSLCEEELRTPCNKRKARNSPGAHSPGDKEMGKISPTIGETQATAIIRKRKTKAKKICRNPLLDSSPSESMDEDEVGRSGDTSERRSDISMTPRPNRLSLRRTRPAKSDKKEEDRTPIMVISSDEDVAGVSSSSTTGNQSKQNKKRNKKVIARKDSLGNADSPDLTHDDSTKDTENTDKPHERGKGLAYKLPNKVSQNNRQGKVDYGLWTVSEIKAFAYNLVEDIDTARMKCSKLQGVIDGVLKDRITGLKDVLECLVDKIEAQGDMKLLQKERLEATLENKRLKKDITKLEQNIIQKDKEMEGIKLIYEEMEERYIQLDKDKRRTTKLQEKGIPVTEEGTNTRELLQDTYALIHEDNAVFRPPIKGVRKYIPMDTTSHSVPLTVRDTDNPTSSREYTSEQDEEFEIETINQDKGRASEISRQIKLLNEERKRLASKRKQDRSKPRIISNRQLIPPRDISQKITIRKDREKLELRENYDPRTEDQLREQTNREYLDVWQTAKNRRPSNRKNTNPRTGPRIRKPPRNAVVAIRLHDETTSYATILKKARQEVSLGELGIETTKIKKGINGSLLIEIPGNEGKEKAKILAEKLREKLGEKDITITRPTTMGELRISGLDESVAIEEVSSLIIEIGNCDTEEIKISPIRRMYNGMGSVWIRCPLVSANKLADLGKIRIGWTGARIELLDKRPLQCYKCWEFGHARFSCHAPIDRTGHCYNCGIPGHTAKNCDRRDPKCVICEGKNYQSNHRIGSRFCKSATLTGPRKFPRIVESNIRREETYRTMEGIRRQEEQMDFIEGT